MNRGWIGSSLLLLSLLLTGGALALWKHHSLRSEEAAAAHQAEPMEAISSAVAVARQHVQTSTAIGTVLALRSISLENELAGTVREVLLEPGAVVEEGAVLVALDVSVEEAELKAQEAQAALGETLLGRMQRASESHGASEADVDRARAQRDVTLAEVARTKAIIEKKTIRAPFRARVGLADVHPGQYLSQGTMLTTLQGVDEAVNVDFTVSQGVAAALAIGTEISVSAIDDPTPRPASIVAIDARVDPATRNERVRARMDGAAQTFTPGSSVRVRVPAGQPLEAVAVPASALRKGPAGDHVFVLESDERGALRAHERAVVSGAVLGDEVLVLHGLAVGEQVATAGSFKLREGVLVAVADAQAQAAH